MTTRDLIVDPNDSDAFKTISEALDDAMDGEKIIVREGSYKENLVIDKQVHIVGDGSMEDIKITGDGVTPVVTTQSPLVNLRNLTLINGSGKVATVECESGICDVKYCNLQGGTFAMNGQSGTRMNLENSFVAGSVSGGVYGHDCLTLTVSDTLIEKCGGSGVIAEECEEVLVERSTFMDVSPHGIECSGEGSFDVKDCEIHGVPSAPILDNGEPVNDEMDRVWYERRERDDDE